MKLLRTIHYHFMHWFNYFFVTYMTSGVVNSDSRKYSSERWGSPYGGWFLPLGILDKKSIVYSVGVGDDISFDQRLAERVGCVVNLFDPTPQSIEFMKRFKKNKKLKFFPYGVWDADGKQKFYAPLEDSWVSFSLVGSQSDQSAFVAPCFRIQTIMKKLNHNHIDFLKLDISGAEYSVLEDMMTSNITPKILCVEFDQPANPFDTIQAIRSLTEYGYILVVRDLWDYTFIHRSVAEKIEQ